MVAPITEPTLGQLNNLPGFPTRPSPAFPNNFALGTYLNLLAANTPASIPATGPALDLYVNTIIGSDSTGDGLTVLTPWATIEYALSQIDTSIPLARAGLGIRIWCRGAFGVTTRVSINKIFPASATPGLSYPLVQIIGMADTLESSSTVVSAVAGAETPLVAVTLNNAPGANVVGKTFLEVVSFGGILRRYYPVVTIAGAVVSVVATDASFFTAGDVTRVFDVGGVNGATVSDVEAFLYGAIEFVGFAFATPTAGAVFYGPFDIGGTDFSFFPNVSGCRLAAGGATTFFENMKVNGCHFVDPYAPIFQGCSVSDINVISITTYFNFTYNNFLGTVRHKIATAKKFETFGGVLTLGGIQRLEGAGIGYLIREGAACNNLATIAVGGGLNNRFQVTKRAFLSASNSVNSGTCAGASYVFEIMSGGSGIESSFGTSVSTPVGDDIVVGSLAVRTAASLPIADPTQLCYVA